MNNKEILKGVGNELIDYEDGLVEEYENVVKLANFLLHQSNVQSDVMKEKLSPKMYEEIKKESKKRASATLTDDILTGNS